MRRVDGTSVRDFGLTDFRSVADQLEIGALDYPLLLPAMRNLGIEVVGRIDARDFGPKDFRSEELVPRP